MDLPTIKGVVAKQAHVAIPDGTFEEEFARDGFFGRYAHLYRTRPLVEWSEIDGPLMPRAYDLNPISHSADTDFLNSRKVYLANEDVRVCFSRFSNPTEYCYRNADADELVFVHEGSGILTTDFGDLNFNKGDYLVIPRGTIQEWTPKGPCQFLTMESFSEIGFPEKGMLGQHALIDPACIRTPNPKSFGEIVAKNASSKKFELRIKRADQFTKVYYDFHPLNVVGWKGNLSVYQMNVADIRPVMSERYHLPPTAHCTFVAKNFVVCTFLPRSLENGDPEAMKVPFHHLNIDFDEILFYHSGEFFSRAGIKPGMMTFHPQGIEHGPQRKAVERAKQATRTEEVAVMIDTKRPIFPTEAASKTEWKDYVHSWK